VRLWTPKFGLGLIVLVAFLCDAFWRGPDPITGAARHVLPFADTGIASFVFLLDFLYVVSHFGQWVLSKVRRVRAPEPEAPKKGRKKRRAHSAAARGSR